MVYRPCGTYYYDLEKSHLFYDHIPLVQMSLEGGRPHLVECITLSLSNVDQSVDLLIMVRGVRGVDEILIFPLSSRPWIDKVVLNSTNEHPSPALIDIP